MNDEFYIRWKLAVTGPFSPDDIKAMLLKGRITKHHQVSVDRVAWTPLHASEAFRAECHVCPAPNQIPQSMVASTVVAQEPENHAHASQEESVEKQKLRVKPIDTDSGQDRWFYIEDGQTTGPVTMWGLRELADSGTIQKQSPICKEGDEQWVKAGKAFPSFWHSAITRQALIWQRDNSGGPQLFVYAGFWLRFCAAFIDTILAGIITFIAVFIGAFGIGLLMGMAGADTSSVTLAGQILGIGIEFIISWVYFVNSEASPLQATLGKRAMGIYVVNLDGNRISQGQAIGRYFGKILSGLLLGIGYIMAGFTERKQALHDIMAQTLVLKRGQQ